MPLLLPLVLDLPRLPDRPGEADVVRLDAAFVLRDVAPVGLEVPLVAVVDSSSGSSGSDCPF